MHFLEVFWLAICCDLLVGDPRWFPHPVRIMGWLALRLEKITRTFPVSERSSGCLTVILLLFSLALFFWGVFALLLSVSPLFFWLGAIFFLYTTIAARDLIRHAEEVYEALAVDLVQARSRVAMLVGRDTDQLGREGIICACVESVAENMSDGIVAPLFWATAGAIMGLCFGPFGSIACGVSAALLYKAVNTMDSMFGYTNEQYRYFGTCPALLDDVCNVLPARISGWAVVAATLLCSGDMKKSWQILLRDHGRHASPNAGWTEAAMAGALGLQLGGDSRYFGKLHSKPTLGDDVNRPERSHIRQADRLVLVGSMLCLVLFSLLYMAVAGLC